MAQATKTTGSTKTVKTSATNLDLNVTNEDEFKALYKGFQDSYAKTEVAHKLATTKLNHAKREDKWKDLSAAAAVIEVLMAPENVGRLFEALEYHGIPIVEDASKANEFLPPVRLLFGEWPQPSKSAKETDAPKPFTWSRSVEVYAKVLREAKRQKIAPRDLFERLKTDKGYNKLKTADDRKHLDSDQAEQDRKTRAKAVINDTPKSVIEAEPFNLPKKDRPTLVALWAVVSADGSELSIQGMLPTSVSSIEAHIDRISPKLYQQIELRREREKNAKLERELAEARKQGMVTISSSDEVAEGQQA